MTVRRTSCVWVIGDGGILTAEPEDPAATKDAQQGRQGGGHRPVWHDHVGHWRRRREARLYEHVVTEFTIPRSSTAHFEECSLFVVDSNIQMNVL